MKYTFGNINPKHIFRAFHNSKRTQIEIITVDGHHLFIETPTKAEYEDCVKQFQDYCAEHKIGVEVTDYEKN